MNDRRKVLELFDEQEASWKQRSAEGIERYRKGNGRITVVDKEGTPVSNAKIKLTQTNHEFRFGANLFMLDELESEEKNEKYKKYYSEIFNMATLPFYWDALEPERGKPRSAKDRPKIYRRPSPDLCIEFCEKHGIEPREHALAYSLYFPKWLYDASVDEVKRELERRYAEISERYADKIRTIEVTNEMFWPSAKDKRTAFYDSEDYVEWCFKMAEKYFPNNQLGINESSIVIFNENCRVTDRYYLLIKLALLKGLKIDAIGLQYHLFNKIENEYENTRSMLNPQSIYNYLDLYSNFGKPLQITEVTVPSFSWDTENEEIQAEIVEKLYTIWFSHPNMEQIIYWNLVDGYAHGAKPGDMSVGENYYYGGLLRFDLSPKPAYVKIKELLQKRWHTEEELVTDKNGCVEFRGFYGEYDLVITANGKTVTRKIQLSSKADNARSVIL